MPDEGADDPKSPSPPAAKKMRAEVHKTVHFSQDTKPTGGGLSQRQGQPLATLQPSGQVAAFGQEAPGQALYPVDEWRGSTLLQGLSLDATQLREDPPPRVALHIADTASGTSSTDNPGTSELLSSAGRLLPRTPLPNTLARGAADPSLDSLALLSDQEGANRSWAKFLGSDNGPPVPHPLGERCCADRCTAPGRAASCNIWKQATSPGVGLVCRLCSMRFDRARRKVAAAQVELRPEQATTPRTGTPIMKKAHSRSGDLLQPNEGVEDDEEDEAAAEYTHPTEATATLQLKLGQALQELEKMKVQALEERKQADAGRHGAEQERARLQQALDQTTASLGAASAQLQTTQEKLDQTVHWLNFFLAATHFNKK